MKLPHGAWVVVADGAKMLVLENHGEDDLPDLRVRRHEETDPPRTHEAGTDRPGRVSPPGSPRRAALGQTDWHALEKERFADDLAEMMNGWARDGRMTKALLIAAPRTLGELRQHLTPQARATLLAELPLDLAHATLEAIETAVGRA